MMGMKYRMQEFFCLFVTDVFLDNVEEGNSWCEKFYFVATIYTVNSPPKLPRLQKALVSVTANSDQSSPCHSHHGIRFGRCLHDKLGSDISVKK